jgi:hypothetical protein
VTFSIHIQSRLIKVITVIAAYFSGLFKKVKVESKQYLQHLIHYIHHNFANTYSGWVYSSYSTIIEKGMTNVKREEVLKIFGNKETFMDSHKQVQTFKKINHLTF